MTIAIVVVFLIDLALAGWVLSLVLELSEIQRKHERTERDMSDLRRVQYEELGRKKGPRR